MTARVAGALARARRVLAGLRPTHASDWVLAGLLVGGLVVRVFAAASWWPTAPTLSDAIGYATHAEGGLLEDPQHPAGYSAVLAAIGILSREVAVPVVLQHLSAIPAALLLYAAVRRLTGSPWPALAPAAVVLLNADLVFLEHTVMSESLFLLAVAGSLYAAVRAIDAPGASLGWALACGALLAFAATLRSAGLFLIPVVVLAVVLARPGPWRAEWRSPVAVGGAAAVLLLAYALASTAVNGRFEIGPTQGWHLYARVAPFADCSAFEPPEGTERLCETTPPEERLGLDWYLYDEASPAHRVFGELGEQDGELGEFGRAVILNQPRDYLAAVWDDVSGYFVPSAYPFRPGAGSDLDPQLDWAWVLGPGVEEVPVTVAEIERGIEEAFFNPFSTDVDPGGLEQLRDYQTVFRFGATALSISALLTLLGLLIGSRRDRVAAGMFGVGGLAVLLLPMFSVYYAARYTVPIAPLVAAGAAIGAFSLWRLEAERRREARAGR